MSTWLHCVTLRVTYAMISLALVLNSTVALPQTMHSLNPSPSKLPRFHLSPPMSPFLQRTTPLCLTPITYPLTPTRLHCATLRVTYSMISPALVLVLPQTVHSTIPSLSKLARFCLSLPRSPSLQRTPPLSLSSDLIPSMLTWLHCTTLRVTYAMISPTLVLNSTVALPQTTHSSNPSPSKLAQFHLSPPTSPFLRRMPPLSLPLITYSSSPPNTPEAVGLNLSHVVSFPSNTSQCTWARTHQGHLTRIKRQGSSCYPPQSQNHLDICETQDDYSSSCSVDCSPSNQRPCSWSICLHDVGCLVNHIILFSIFESLYFSSVLFANPQSCWPFLHCLLLCMCVIISIFENKIKFYTKNMSSVLTIVNNEEHLCDYEW